MGIDPNWGVLMSRVVVFILLTIPLASIFPTLSIAENAGPSLTHTQWAKWCTKSQDGAQICLVSRDAIGLGRDGVTACWPIGSAALIERKGDATRTLCVMLPTSMAQQPGVRITIDQGQPIARPYGRCHANGCMADYEAGVESVTLLKQGQVLVVEGIDSTNQPITVRFPLTDFAQLYDGPSSEVRALFELRTWQGSEEERKLREEERKRLVDEQCGTRP
jgi:invasion protein IalB